MSSGICLVGDGAAKKFNELCRHDMIVKLMNDILVDMTVCQIEGWDFTEYARMLKSEIDRIVKQFKEDKDVNMNQMKFEFEEVCDGE